MRPHHYCLPVLKREHDRAALLAAATGDDPRFFLGTDSAPHARRTKEAAVRLRGIFSAHAALELYAEAFAGAGRLDRLRGIRFRAAVPTSTACRATKARSRSRASLERAGELPVRRTTQLVPLRAGDGARAGAW